MLWYTNLRVSNWAATKHGRNGRKTKKMGKLDEKNVVVKSQVGKTPKTAHEASRRKLFRYGRAEHGNDPKRSGDDECDMVLSS